LGAQPDDTDTYFTAVSHRILHITSGHLQSRLVDGERLQGSTQGLDDAVAFGAGNDQRRAQRNRRAEATAAAGAADDDALVAAKIDDAANLGRIELLLG
jgi:hypothetical protein